MHTVLYIEDNGASVALVRAILQSHPHLTLTSQADGARGLAAALSEPPSMILLDLHLPGLSGEQVLVALKADPLTAQVPVVIVTADVITTDPERLRALGATDFVTKPIDVGRLCSIVDAVLLEREVGAPVHAEHL